MKAVWIAILVTFVSLSSHALCSQIYLNIGPLPTELQITVASELRRHVSRVDPKQELNITRHVLYPHLDLPASLEKDAIVLDLKDETDFTGADVNISVYKTDLQAKGQFMGSHSVSTRYKKISTLISLAKIALNLSCGNKNY